MKIFLLMLIVLSLAALSELFAAQLKVNIVGIKESKGSIRVSLFQNAQKEIFPDISNKVKTLTIDAKKDIVNTVFFANLKSGYYAVIVLHDVDNNQEIDTFLGIPIEPLGSSGKFIRTKPTFNKAKFFIEDRVKTVIEIKVH